MNEPKDIITPSMKISVMLRMYPDTLDVLLKASPHFNKLNNSFLRKTLGARVTVEQASSIAGVSLPNLIQELNKKINRSITEDEIKELTMPFSDQQTTNDNNFKNIQGHKIIDLDVRDDIQNGMDPIHKIKPAINELKDDEVLHLINSFEPVPLYSVLGNKGFAHFTEVKDKVYHVYFYKEKKEKPEEEIVPPSSSDSSENEIIEIDVRELTPPEPMMKILSMLPNIPAGGILLVHHHREPMMLYDKLEEQGFTAVTQKINDNYFKVVITRK